MLSTNDRQFLIGFDRAFAQIDKMLNNQPKYPPHDIIRVSDTQYQIVLAVAGFKKTDIDVTLDDSMLKIVGAKIHSVADQESAPDYVYNGISNRSFEKTFRLHESVRVVDATVVDGLLTINLEVIVPETKKPLRIDLR